LPTRKTSGLDALRLTPTALQCSAFLIATFIASQATLAANSNTRLLVGIPSGLPGHEALEDNKLKINDPYKRSVTECIATHWVRLNKPTMFQMVMPT
jgi:hypothetical protein